jgi:threonine aldolase
MTAKINLLNDYNTVAHPRVLAALEQAAVAQERFLGYGLDEHSEAARSLIRDLVGDRTADVHFLMGGTQTNLTALGAFLRPHEAVIAAVTAHINGHETGAVEATGHKILTCESADGKVCARDIEPILAVHDNEHLTRPRLLFISQATETGTVYSLSELEELGCFCRGHDLLLYVDGARLGPALAAEGADVGLTDLARVADAFYIGGTKNGALFGEALVITNPTLQQDFRYAMKQRGAMAAKGFVLGIQFEALLGGGEGSGTSGASGTGIEACGGGSEDEDCLYLELARQANRQASRLREGLHAAGYRLEVEAFTNQVFPIVTEQAAANLERDVYFERWNRLGDDELSIRFVTTWLTTDEEVQVVLSAVS